MTTLSNSDRSPLNDTRRIRGVLFDKDGTLLDYQATWAPANRAAALYASRGDIGLAARLLRAGGQDPDSDYVRPGSPLAADTAAAIAAHWCTLLDDWQPQALADGMEAIFHRFGTTEAIALPGVLDVLDHLRRSGYRLGVATNDSATGADSSLRCIGLEGAFEFVAGWDSGHGAKPGPGMVHAFCAALDLEPAEVAVVGDNVHDLAMGRAAGAGRLIAVLTGTGERDDLTPHADHVLDNLHTLPQLLDHRTDEIRRRTQARR